MTLHDLRCPVCSAHASPDADWCTLCFADLRVPPTPPVPPVAEAAPEVEPAVEPALVPDHAGKQVAEHAEGGGGKHARAATTYDAVVLDGAQLTALEARADEMLAVLAAESSHRLGPFADRLESTSARVVAGLIGLVVLSTAGVLVMTVLGHFI